MSTTPIAATETPTRTPKTRPTNGGCFTGFEAIEHIVRLDNPDIALCGVDQTDVPWDMGWPPCQACLTVAQGRMN